MSALADSLLERILPVVRTRLPRGIDADYLDAFVERNRPMLALVIDQQLGPILARVQPANQPGDPGELAELWTPGKRSAANLAAMRLLATKAPEDMVETDRAVLRGYSGWGGLSIRAAAPQFPAGVPHPEERGLIHEYYTPTRVAREVARLVAPLVADLADDEGLVHALEPSAGIGRFLHAFQGPAFADLRWHACEWSELSGTLLAALFPSLDLHVGPFERWVREQGPAWAGRIRLLISNPPYGARGASIAEDTDRAYREKLAYHYFLRRGLDLLAPNGLGVFLVPAGFLTGRTAAFRTLREKVLQRHHLACAYRLPSMRPNGREALFPGAMLVTIPVWRTPLLPRPGRRALRRGCRRPRHRRGQLLRRVPPPHPRSGGRPRRRRRRPDGPPSLQLPGGG